MNNIHPKLSTIAVGLSGGVDSAVTAYLLKNQGHNVIGLFMRNWEADANDPYCQATQDLSDAEAICCQLDIPLQTVNFAQTYWDQVFQHCLNEFAAGRTPNPDVLCNREIKFKVFLEHALSLGADYLATGHYAQITQKNGHLSLTESVDIQKDQTYFLHMLKEEQLKHSLFPIGHLTKPEIRKIAANIGLVNATKKDSTGICFIGERKFKTFLSEFLLAQPGMIETIDGKTIGRHDGIMFYTIGQRKGLAIGGLSDCEEKPWFVVDKDIKRNVLIVAQGSEHPMLYRSQLTATQLTWVSHHPPSDTTNLSAKIRYRQTHQSCKIIALSHDSATVHFEHPQRAVTPGQSIVFYQENSCLGGGIIE